MYIYLARSISGCESKEVYAYYTSLAEKVRNLGLTPLTPLEDVEELRTSFEERSGDNKAFSPSNTNHAIVERDCWLVQTADILLVDLTCAKHLSIGAMFELAWGHLLRKHTIVVLKKGSYYDHAFVLEAADVVFETIDEALNHLKKLSIK